MRNTFNTNVGFVVQVVMVSCPHFLRPLHFTFTQRSQNHYKQSRPFVVAHASEARALSNCKTATESTALSQRGNDDAFVTGNPNSPWHSATLLTYCTMLKTIVTFDLRSKLWKKSIDVSLSHANVYVGGKR